MDVNELARSTLNLVHSELIGRRIRVNISLSPQAPFVLGDAVQLQQVVLKLLLNAADAVNEMPILAAYRFHLSSGDEGGAGRDRRGRPWLGLAGVASAAVPAVLHHEGERTAMDAGVTLEDVQGLLVAVAPIVGTARVLSASVNVAEGIGFAIDLLEASLEADADEG